MDREGPLAVPEPCPAVLASVPPQCRPRATRACAAVLVVCVCELPRPLLAAVPCTSGGRSPSETPSQLCVLTPSGSSAPLQARSSAPLPPAPPLPVLTQGECCCDVTLGRDPVGERKVGRLRAVVLR